MMGTFAVALRAANAAGAPAARMTSTLNRTSSAARRGSSSKLLSVDRHSMPTFRPSMYPRARKPCWNASTNETDPVHLLGLLRPHGEQHKNSDSDHDREPNHPHWAPLGDGWRESSRPELRHGALRRNALPLTAPARRFRDVVTLGQAAPYQ